MLAMSLILLLQGGPEPVQPPMPAVSHLNISQLPVPHGPVPRGNPANWIQSSDYPATALGNGEGGTTVFTLSVDATGGVTDCHVVASSGSAALDQATCDLIRARAVFFPAADRAHKPVAGLYTNKMHWQR